MSDELSPRELERRTYSPTESDDESNDTSDDNDSDLAEQSDGYGGELPDDSGSDSEVSSESGDDSGDDSLSSEPSPRERERSTYSPSESDDDSDDTTDDNDSDLAEQSDGYGGELPDNTGDDTSTGSPRERERSTYSPSESDDADKTSAGPVESAMGAGLEDHGEGYVLPEDDQPRVYDEEATQERLRRQFAEQSQVSESDVRVDIGAGGAVTYRLTDEGAERFEGDPGDEIGTAEIPTTQEFAREMESKAIEQTGATDTGEVRIVESDGSLSAEFTARGREKAVAADMGVTAADIDIRDGTVVPTSEEGRAAVIEQSGSGLAEEGDGYGGTLYNDSDLAEQSDGYGGEISAQDQAMIELREKVGKPVDPEDVEIVERDGETVARYGEEGKRAGSQERFDFDWSMGIWGPEDEVEQAIDSTIDALTKLGRTAGGLAGGGAGELYMQPLRGEELNVEKAIEANREDQTRAARDVENVVSGVALLPAMGAGTVKSYMEFEEWRMEAAEISTDAVLGKTDTEQSLEEFEEFQQDTEAAANEMVTESVESIQKNPRQFAGMAVGSLLGTGALFAATSGTRLGAAARWSIQPGEELATVGLTGVASRTARGRRLLRSMPGERVDVEEIALASGKMLGERVKNIEIDPEFKPSPRQQDMIEFGRPAGSAEATTGGESPTGSIEEGSLAGRSSGPRAQPSESPETGVTGARSEPLGSDTEEILDASIGPTESGSVPDEGVELGPTGERSAESTGVTEEMEQVAGEATAREQLGQAIEEFGVDVREYAASTDRGRMDLTGPSRSEVGPSIDQDRVTPNLYQQAVTDRTFRDFRNLEGGDYEGVRPPFETESRAETDVESMSQRATEPEVRTDDATGLPEVGRMEAIGPQIGEGIGVTDVAIGRQQPGVDIGELPMEGSDIRVDARADTFVDARPRAQEAPAEFGFEYEYETGLDTEFEIGRLDMGFEIDSRPETRLDTRMYGDRQNDDIGGPVVDPEEFGIDYTNPVATSFDVLGIGRVQSGSDVGDMGIDAEKIGASFEPPE